MTAEQIDAQMRNGGHASADEASRQLGGHWWGRGHALGADGRQQEAARKRESPAELRQRRAAAADAAQARVSPVQDDFAS